MDITIHSTVDTIVAFLLRCKPRNLVIDVFFPSEDDVNSINIRKDMREKTMLVILVCNRWASNVL